MEGWKEGRQHMQNEKGLMSEGLATVEEAREFLGLSRSKVYSLMDGGELAYVKIGRARRIPRRALTALAEKNLTGGWKTGALPA